MLPLADAMHQAVPGSSARRGARMAHPKDIHEDVGNVHEDKGNFTLFYSILQYFIVFYCIFTVFYSILGHNRAY